MNTLFAIMLCSQSIGHCNLVQYSQSERECRAVAADYESGRLASPVGDWRFSCQSKSLPAWRVVER